MSVRWSIFKAYVDEIIEARRFGDNDPFIDLIDTGQMYVDEPSECVCGPDGAPIEFAGSHDAGWIG